MTSTDSTGDELRIVTDGNRYVPSDDLELAVRVARAIGRPLLLYGEPGSGKSTLAAYVAVTHGLRYYEHVTTARTEPQDFLWTFDHVRRLSDAQVGPLDGHDRRYVTPGPLWWAFQREVALAETGRVEPFREWNEPKADQPAVVLIDEIDKADPDTPNGLLGPLADRRFKVTDLDGEPQVAEQPFGANLIIITSNEERDLPEAFVRRCVVSHLPLHDDEALLDIVDRHLGDRRHELSDELLRHLLDELAAERRKAGHGGRRLASTAEFLDAVNACVRLEIGDVTGPQLRRVIGMTLAKAHDTRFGR
ncbi:MoxR-like ATPase [Saccharothrix saharensis]|uniref:MoxR-like ATPase n=1 Tax=Saccharothrix saharensis TaxID=571190 RepID=A0A543JNN0_9PSEU|nr:MoxR family ATPase [Saccharothrix saharensis]TQM84471.1 MoxR-like ATPase [Saccharothrix saharensis]